MVFVEKPVVDLLLVVTNSADEATYGPAFETTGYVRGIRESDWRVHRGFKSPDINSIRNV